jgi:hypothetical protein
MAGQKEAPSLRGVIFYGECGSIPCPWTAQKTFRYNKKKKESKTPSM